MAKHAFLSDSSSDCWINCPPSAKLCEGIVDEPSSFAQEGTDCHKLCAYLVEKGLGRNVKNLQVHLAITMEKCKTVLRNIATMS